MASSLGPARWRSGPGHRVRRLCHPLTCQRCGALVSTNPDGDRGLRRGEGPAVCGCIRARVPRPRVRYEDGSGGTNRRAQGPAQSGARTRGRAGRLPPARPEGRHAAGRARVSWLRGPLLTGHPCPPPSDNLPVWAPCLLQGICDDGKETASFYFVLHFLPSFRLLTADAQSVRAARGRAPRSRQCGAEPGKPGGGDPGETPAPRRPLRERSPQSGCLGADGPWTPRPTGFSFPFRTSSRDTC